MKFDRTTLRTFTISNLHYYLGKAELAQGSGPGFSQMLENRINRLNVEIERRNKLLTTIPKYPSIEERKAILMKQPLVMIQLMSDDAILTVWYRYFG